MEACHIAGTARPDSRGGGLHFYHEWYLGIRMFKDGAVLKAVLSFSKALWALELQDRVLGLPRSKVVNGAVCRQLSWHQNPKTFMVFTYYSFFILFLPIFKYMLLYYVSSFIFIFLHCPLSGPVLTYISLLIIPCMIVYVTNKQEP